MKIKDFQEKMNINLPLLLTKCVKGSTNSGEPYLSLTLQDDTGYAEGKVWSVKPSTEANCVVGEVVNITGSVNRYQNALQLKIVEVERLPQDSIDVLEYLPEPAISPSDLKGYIGKVAESITNGILRNIVTALLERYESRFYSYPAASRNHHDCPSGLALHTKGMLELAAKLIEVYPSINQDLLYSGVILHDLGKVVELTGPIATEYTTEGKLLGHISILQSEVYEIAKTKGWHESEEVMLLRHMILSHHGELEFGSPVLPMIVEAEILRFIDNIDARMNMLDKALSTVEKGGFTPRIFPLENRSFYKPKGD